MPEHATRLLVILGASARAAAFSAARASFSPLAIDLFADADLAGFCPTRRVERYPADLPTLLEQMPDAPWMYTGAMENHPEIVDRLATIRPLLGISGRNLRRVRDPFAVGDALRGHGLHTPEVARTSENLPTDGGWLRKKLRSAGGFGIERFEGETSRDASGCYYQRFMPGVSCAAIYIADGDRAVLLGISRQLVGPEWTGDEFRYGGSIGPLAVSAAAYQQFQRIGQALAENFGLAGLFGVDAILDGDQVFVLEVNPRYTASVEVLERALGWRSIELHVDACQGKLPAEGEIPGLAPIERPGPGLIAGKAIIYARRTLTISSAFTERVAAANAQSCDASGGWPTTGDVPHPGATIEAGRPVTTALAAAESMGAVESRLRERIAEIDALRGNLPARE